MRPFNSTTKQHLVEECIAHAKDLESLEAIQSYLLNQVLDTRYITDSKKQYLGSELLINYDGPSIKINTLYNTVEGIFGLDTFATHYKNDQIDEILELKFNHN